VIYSIRLNMSDATETHFINVDLEVRSTPASTRPSTRS